MDTSNVEKGLSSAKDGVLSLVKFGVNTVGVPIAAAVVLAFLLLNIVKAVTKHREGQDYGHNIGWIIGLVVALALICSFPVWGWQLIGG